MLKFNGETIDAKPGETLLHAARRHGSYVWFLCDGRGICQACACHVLAGTENLSPPTGMERVALGREARRSHRLACQARLAGSGPVAVTSCAQELGGQVGDALQGKPLNLVAALLERAAGAAAVSPRLVAQLLRRPPTPARMMNYARDAVRVAGRLVNRMLTD